MHSLIILWIYFLVVILFGWVENNGNSNLKNVEVQEWQLSANRPQCYHDGEIVKYDPSYLKYFRNQGHKTLKFGLIRRIRQLRINRKKGRQLYEVKRRYKNCLAFNHKNLMHVKIKNESGDIHSINIATIMCKISQK